MTTTKKKGGAPRKLRPAAAAWHEAFQRAAGRGGAWDKGLALLRADAVGQVTAAPGQLVAVIAAADGRPLRPRIHFPMLTAEEWERLADHTATLPEAAAELLAGRLPDSIAQARPGVPALVPAPRDLRFSCTCPPSGRAPLCAHAAALGHAVTARVATSPATLAVARGMTTARFAELVRARTPAPAPTPDASGTVRAQHAYVLWHHRREQAATAADGPGGGDVTNPADPAGPADLADLAGTADLADLNDAAPPVGTLPAPPGAGPGADTLDRLVSDAADRARALLEDTGGAEGPGGGDGPGGDGAEGGQRGEPPEHGEGLHDLPGPQDPPGPWGPPYTELADTVRLLATGGVPSVSEVAGRAGCRESELRRLLVAHRHGGPAGVHAAAGPLPADPGVLRAAADAVEPSRLRRGTRLEVDGNRLTDPAAGVQVRLGPDGRWYPFTAAGEDWRPAAGHSPDPAAAYRAALQARGSRTAAHPAGR